MGTTCLISVSEQTEIPPDGYSGGRIYEIIPDIVEEGVYHLHETDDPDVPSIWSRLFGFNFVCIYETSLELVNTSGRGSTRRRLLLFVKSVAMY